MRRITLALSTSTLALLFAPMGALHAQTIDYGALQELFGEPITASATGKPQKVSEVPANMDILTQDDIRQSGADNLPDTLQFIPGLNFRRSSFNDGEVSIRGYDQPWNPRMLVLVDGRPVYEDFYGDVIWSMIPIELDEIRQIEVVKGPSSALFGFNAASGVINIVTYDPLNDNVNAITARTGTQSLADGSAVTTLRLGDNAALRASVGGMRASEFDTTGIPSINTTGLLTPHSDSANVDLRWRVAPDVMLSFEGASAQMSRNFPADQTPENDRTNDLRAGVTAATGIGTLQWDNYWTVWDINYEGGQAQEAVNTVYDTRLSDLFKIGLNHSFRLSAEFKSNDATGQFFDNATIKQDIASVGGMWDWQIAPNLSFTNSVRMDHMQLGLSGTLLPGTGLLPSAYNDRALNVYSFNSGLVDSVTENDVVRLMFSRGYQLPSLNDLAQQIYVPPPNGPYFLLGQPNLQPTSVTNVEADYDRKFDAIGATLRTAIFAQRNASLFGYDAAGVAVGSQSANFGHSDEVGGEISLKGTSSIGVRWTIGYSYAEIVDHVAPNPPIAPGVYTTYNGGTPKHTIDFGLGYTVGRWELDTQGRWQSSFQDWRFPDAAGFYYPIDVKPYVTTNVRVGFRPIDRLTVSVTAEQLNQAEIYERASIPVDRRAIVAATVRF